MAVGTTRGKRRLGRYLRPLLARSELTPKDIAKHARCSPQTVFRLLGGDNLPRIHLFMTILSLLGLSEEERARAIQLWEVADVDPSVIANGKDLPESYRRYRMDELEASFVRVLDTVVVSGLLQTPAYAMAIHRATGKRLDSAWTAEVAAADRLERQAPLHRTNQPMRLHCLMTEGALRCAVGGPEVFKEQLTHLLEACAMPNVTLQVLPFSAGAFGAMSGPVALLTFPEEDEPETAYVESQITLHRVENNTDVKALSSAWDNAAGSALPPVETSTLIRKLRDNVERQR